MDPIQTNFNYKLSKARSVIEGASWNNGCFKNRFLCSILLGKTYWELWKYAIFIRVILLDDKEEKHFSYVLESQTIIPTVHSWWSWGSFSNCFLALKNWYQLVNMNRIEVQIVFVWWTRRIFLYLYFENTFNVNLLFWNYVRK